MNEEIKPENVRIHSRADELIACLECEIAKRDEELAACRVAVENCEVFRARIAALESQYQRDVYGLNNEGDPIGGDPAGGYANDNARLRTELAAIKAQEPVAWEVYYADDDSFHTITKNKMLIDGYSSMAYVIKPLYASPVSEAKEQGVVMPEGWIPLTIEHEPGYPEDVAFGPKRMMDRLKKWLDRYFEMRLNAAPAAPAADAWIQVSERLPGEDDQVLCWCEDETVAWAEVSSHHNSFFTDMTHELLPVTHWMPLPAAPIKIEANRHDQ